MTGDLVALVRLVRYLRDRRIDVIHTHGSKSRLIGGLAGLLARVPLRVQSAHGFAFNSRQPRWKNALFTALERLMGALHHELVLESAHDLEEASSKRLPRSRPALHLHRHRVRASRAGVVPGRTCDRSSVWMRTRSW